MIKTSQATVYFAPTKGRRYLTKWGAIRAEARAIIYKHFPAPERILFADPAEIGGEFDIEIDAPERYQRYFKALCRALNRRFDHV